MINGPWRYSSITPASGSLSDISPLFCPFNPHSAQTEDKLCLIRDTGICLEFLGDSYTLEF